MICRGPTVPTQEVKPSVAWRALVCFPKSLGPGADRYICVALAMIAPFSYATTSPGPGTLRHVMGSSIGERTIAGVTHRRCSFPSQRSLSTGQLQALLLCQPHLALRHLVTEEPEDETLTWDLGSEKVGHIAAETALAFQSLHRESLLINASFCRWLACLKNSTLLREICCTVPAKFSHLTSYICNCLYCM
jgi:hypothetical protein